MPNYSLKGFGALKWNGSQYEFEGDPHESAKVFAECLLSIANTRPDQSLIASLMEALAAASSALYEASDKFHILSGYIKDDAARQCAKDKVDEMSSANVIVRAALASAKGAN